MTTPATDGAKRAATRGGVVALLAALCLALVGSGTAAAVDRTLTFSGPFPLIGVQRISMGIEVDLPGTLPRGETVSVPFSLDVDTGSAVADGLRLTGVTELAGTVSAAATVTTGDGAVLTIPLVLPFGETFVPVSGPLTLRGEGRVDVPVPADAALGTARVAAAPTASVHIATDSGLGAFDVALSLDPPSQDTALGTVEIVG